MDVENLGHLYIAGGSQNGTGILENNRTVS